jgi:iron-sulfur cluster repair protein YtfE (RIC family)
MTEEFHCPKCGMDVAVALTFCPECGSTLERVVTQRRRARLAPRPMDLTRLISTLIQEHGDVRRRMQDLGGTLMAGNSARAAELLEGLDWDLRQHIIDEEAQVLKHLIRVYGRDGAERDIKTMQQHRSIHRLMEDVGERLPAWSDADLSWYVELDSLLREHFKQEETQVFPRALEAH